MTKTIGGASGPGVVTTAAGTDELAIWRAANGDTKRITRANFIGAVLTGAGTLATGGFTLTVPGTGTAALTGHDFWLKNDILLVDATFVGSNPIDNRYTTIGAAIAAATDNATILVAPGTYTENITFADAYVKLVGSGMPAYDSTSGRLVGGTIIRGSVDMAGKVGSAIMNLGIDLYGVNSTDALTVSNISQASTYQTIRDVAILGNGYDGSAETRNHAVLCQGGRFLTIDNVRMWNWYHGLVLRTSYVNVTNVYAWACTGNSIIVKSETVSGSATHVNISNVIVDGNAASIWTRGGPIRIQSAEDGLFTWFVNVSNVAAQNTGEGCIIVERADESGFQGALGNINITDVINFNGGDAATRADFDIKGGSNIVLTNCHSVSRSAGYGFRVGYGGDVPTGVKVYNGRALTSGAGAYSIVTGSFDHLELDGQLLYSTRQGDIATPTTTIVPLTQARSFSGRWSAVVSTAAELFRLVCTGAQDSALAIDIMIVSNSGDHSSIDKWRVTGIRYTGTTVRAAAAQDGTILQEDTGTHGTVTVSVNVATANTLKVMATGVTANASCAYYAHVVSDMPNAWTLQNMVVP